MFGASPSSGAPEPGRGLDATALALMAGVSCRLVRTAVVDPLALAAPVLSWKTRLSTAWPADLTPARGAGGRQRTRSESRRLRSAV
ncbi:hypothetical protein [Streptosporangium roseum]|uniref:hypothetical protein n=1 Tax=Streptosporangium roseum TaxID=2001 RepID=UPI0011D2315C|nr:hypothetical protein [Streptosporangium roseum]